MSERKKTTNITGRASPDLKADFADVAAELGINESQLVLALATWAVLHRRLPGDGDGKKPRQAPGPAPHSERLEAMAETLLRRELSAALVVVLAAGACRPRRRSRR
jgi:antitoxin component of RelBE/YafQ-DinJ toxin-antitoxin module